MPHIKKVVTIGGGTGTFTVLSGLKKYPLDLTAIVAMSDDGGSSGVLRDEYGVLPPGDVRQSLVALSDAGPVMRNLFNHRYRGGGLSGHNFGNLFISTLEQVTGSLDKALDVVSKVLNIRGQVVPVTFSKVKLLVELNNGKMIHGEDALRSYHLVSRFGVKRIHLEPRAVANPKAIQAIKEADIIIVGPGHLYGSLIPNFLVKGISEAFIKSKAKKIYVANLMNRHGHTDGFSITDYVDTLERVMGKKGVYDAVVYNTKKPPQVLVKRYADEGEPVEIGKKEKKNKFKLVGANLLAKTIAAVKKGDKLHWQRALIRHDPDKLASAILKA
jgi:uncharacterized cofD-like protein